jgi:hypothetical protein
MSTLADRTQDVMQVCRNGHVITDQLRSFPERALTHCDRCGATTLERCQTCGQELPGAVAVPGLHPVGVRQPPCYCPTCGAAFPWTLRRRPPKREALTNLEGMLRRLPHVIRQLRSRHGERPPFRVVDELDLEDLVRSLLPLHFDDIRPECRTPRYASCTRTDFVLAPEGIAVTVKLAQPNLVSQVQEDVAYYQRERKCRTLVIFVYDPEGMFREPPHLEAACGEEPEVRFVVGAS